MNIVGPSIFISLFEINIKIYEKLKKRIGFDDNVRFLTAIVCFIVIVKPTCILKRRVYNIIAIVHQCILWKNRCADALSLFLYRKLLFGCYYVHRRRIFHFYKLRCFAIVLKMCNFLFLLFDEISTINYDISVSLYTILQTWRWPDKKK